MTHYHRWLHRVAVLTAVIALLPIVVGALVTTRQWGMAFADYPTSDGHNMFLYPWLAAWVHGAVDKFAEHGHRLAGFLIGVVSTALTIVAWKTESRRWMKGLATLVPVCVLVQGLLGGMRVLADDSRVAVLHGVFAAMVFTLMATVAVLTSRRWLSATEAQNQPHFAGKARPMVAALHVKALAVITPIVILAQFLVGGLVRHLGTALYEHLALACVVVVLVMAMVWTALGSGVAELGRPVSWLFGAMLLQLALGAGAWVTRFGFQSTGYVAVENSPLQIVLRTAHTVVGMLVLMTSVTCALWVFRRAGTQHGLEEDTVRAEPRRFGNALSVQGGTG